MSRVGIPPPPLLQSRVAQGGVTLPKASATIRGHRLAATVPPASRSPQVGHAATAFATIINDAGVRYARGDERVGADAGSSGRYLGIPRHYPLGGLPIDSVSTKSGAGPSWASRPARWRDSLQGIAYENGLAGVWEHTIMKGRNRYADLHA